MTEKPQFDIYPHLDKDIKSAGIKQAEDRLGETVSADVENAIRTKAEQALPEDLNRWFQNEFPAAQSVWARKYSNFVGQVPTSIELKDTNPSFDQTIKRLYKAKQVLSSANYLMPGESLPEGRSVGECMHLVMIPWQEFRNHLDDTHLMEWLKDMRKSQGQEEDDFDAELSAHIMLDKPLLVDPDDASKLLTSRQYLDKKIATDGPWGLMLMQDSKNAGAPGIGPFLLGLGEEAKFAGHNVGAMGIFEWLSLTYQKDSKFPFSIGWLPAVRIKRGTVNPAGLAYRSENDGVIQNRLSSDENSEVYYIRLSVA